MRRFCALLSLLAVSLLAQLQQNPSPMVEHRRAHLRLPEAKPQGQRFTLSLGTLYVPPKPKGLLLFFHGGKWLPEVAASRNHFAALTIQVGVGSTVYSEAFRQQDRFAQLIAEAEQKAGYSFSNVSLGGWSAGCGAIRTILRHQPSYERVQSVLCIDGMHSGYTNGTPGPLESSIESEPIAIWLTLARDAMAGRKRFLLTHSEIFPGTFASTTETADWLLTQLGAKAKPILRWGPMGTQQLSEFKSGHFELRGYAGNSAPDHVDQLHSLSDYLHALN